MSEFNFSTQYRERKSAPPTNFEDEEKSFTARQMPNFSKVQVKKVALRELTVPQEFSLASEQRRIQAAE